MSWPKKRGLGVLGEGAVRLPAGEVAAGGQLEGDSQEPPDGR